MSSPKVFHNKEPQPKSNYVLYPNELFSAINNIFSRNESLVLLTWLGGKGDGSFTPNINYILKMTGIKTAENYYRIKKDLVTSKYAYEDEEGCIHVYVDNILDDYKNGISKTDRKKEREKSKEKRKKIN